jgi:tRNA(fMet)-specific endonuclease VapC
VKYVLDTNIVSELMANNKRVHERLSRLAPKQVSIPQPVLAEIAFGVERLAESKRKDLLREEFEAIRNEIPQLVWSRKVTDAFAEVKAALEQSGRLIEDFDIAIAAHARAQGAVLVTASSKHMERIPNLKLEDWLAD